MTDHDRSGTESVRPLAMFPRPCLMAGLLGLGLLALVAAANADGTGEVYASEVAPHIDPCLVCHSGNGVAVQNGARLQLTGEGAANQDEKNARALQDFYLLPDVSSQLILDKIAGAADHGGGRVHPEQSTGYLAIESFLALLDEEPGGDDDGDAGEEDFWRGLVREPRERTLRRAAILFGGAIPSAERTAGAVKSDKNLRKAILKFMQGPEFHQFILVGANDRLHTEAFNRGMPFEFDSDGFYPTMNRLRATLAADCLENEDRYAQLTTLHRCNQNDWYRFGIARAPLELIARVIEKNQSYKKVLTADHTMVNNFSNLAYRAQADLPAPNTNPGEFDPAESMVFLPGVNRGQILNDDQFEADDCPDGFCQILQHGDFVEQPHAGILTEPAWLARYPTTDTNRNRARARWTYYHFLGVDIEKSAPRTTDPDALADNDNPTLKNPACTICHERLDPVAGAYQNYSDFGIFRERWGGMDSLAESYKYPEHYGGERGDTPYRPGDTWYRDMRKPGIDGKTTSRKFGSVRWLANQIVDDPRFARATVAFWWPAVMGSEVLEAPAQESDPHYRQHLNAYNAQQAELDRLASRFRKGGFKAKQLFADMAMSDWFRAGHFEGDDLADRMVELATVGPGRLLTPEELDRKTYAIFGVRWRQHNVDPWSLGTYSPLSQGDERIAYGGTDSVGVLERNRTMTAVMSNLAERQAVEFACRATILEFNRDELPPVRKQCAQDPWYEWNWDRRQCQRAAPEQRPAIFAYVSRNDVPDTRGKPKIEKQLIALYELLLGQSLKRSDPEFSQLYDLLKSSWEGHQRRGWVDNPCWLGIESINDWSWKWEERDPHGMVAAWSVVVRALMTHYWYLHE